MAFQFRKASCVVVGTFNMYILHPQWLAKRGIIEAGTEVLIETNLAQPGFRFRIAELKTLWIVEPNRILIESEDATVDCGTMIAHVLERLPETPLFAIGNNSIYRAEGTELHLLAPAIRNCPKIESPNAADRVVQRSFHLAVKHDEHKVTNLQVSLTDEEVELSCNVHTELRDRDDAARAGQEAARRFFEDRAAAKSLASHFFGTPTDHEPNRN